MLQHLAVLLAVFSTSHIEADSDGNVGDALALHLALDIRLGELQPSFENPLTLALRVGYNVKLAHIAGVLFHAVGMGKRHRYVFPRAIVEVRLQLFQELLVDHERALGARDRVALPLAGTQRDLPNQTVLLLYGFICGSTEKLDRVVIRELRWHLFVPLAHIHTTLAAP